MERLKASLYWRNFESSYEGYYPESAEDPRWITSSIPFHMPKGYLLTYDRISWFDEYWSSFFVVQVSLVDLKILRSRAFIIFA
ncbi:hypothetical protein CU097_014428 [Rhizopus azygosporus]|uniref:Uncharacterized protein n=1 Tax=Rhizopus azygosporus TaxID=86630 RepID=A0A367K6K1_RHIAZ|nr:hypothetical protein CU097_014428 [Rhizopus azygosporus]